MDRRGRFWVLAIGFLVTAAGCFSPREAPCAFTCISADKRCPDGYLCGDDGLCHRAAAPGDEGVCLLNAPEAGVVASATDAAVD